LHGDWVHSLRHVLMRSNWLRRNHVSLWSWHWSGLWLWLWHSIWSHHLLRLHSGVIVWSLS
jgi:hypothetical protein